MQLRAASIAGTSLLLLACTAEYTGDGTFVDHGAMTARERYVLDLGPVELTQLSQYRYRLVGLPDEEMVVGIEVIEAEPNIDTRPNHPARVRLKVEARDGPVVLLEEAPMNSWVWSYGLRDPKSFYYRTGEAREIPVRTGVMTYQRIGQRADAGWGTYFTPRKGATYLLTLDVLASDSAPSRPARLKVVGGGWK